MNAIHCEDAQGTGRALCGALKPAFAFVSDAVTCKRCLSWPQLVTAAFASRREALKKTRAAGRKKRRAEVTIEAINRSCRECGCTDDDCSQCVEKTGMPCAWVEADLCSACAPIHIGEVVRLTPDARKRYHAQGYHESGDLRFEVIKEKGQGFECALLDEKGLRFKRPNGVEEWFTFPARALFVSLLFLVLGCSRSVVVTSDGAGGSSSSSSTSTSSSSSASSTSTGTLSCIGAIGECEKDATPTPGIACKTNYALSAPDGVCDAGGNCCKEVP